MSRSLPKISLLVFSTLLYFYGKAQINPTSSALGFNVFVQNDLYVKGGSVAGPVAMGRDLILNGNSTVAMNSAGSFPYGAGNTNNFGMVVNGKINFSSGSSTYVNQGYFRIGNTAGSSLYYKDNNNNATNLRVTGGSFNSNPQVQLQRTQAVGTATQAHGIDFAAAFTQMNQYSTVINNLSLNGAVNKITIPAGSNPHIILAPNKVNFINLTSTQLNNLTSQGSLIFDNKPTATQPLIINIPITSDFNWNAPNIGGIGDTEAQYIIWNFYTTNSSLSLSGNNAIYGTILAPAASVSKSSSSNLSGQIIAKSA